jgi:hypothetical protein
MSEGIDFVQRARDLAPMLEEAGDEIERRRELPEHVVAALIDGGLFRMLHRSTAPPPPCPTRAFSAVRNCGRCFSPR